MKIIYLVMMLLIPIAFVHAKTVNYHLIATQKSVNLSGKKSIDFALAINDQIPAPTLNFTEGDDAEILVTNQIPNQELSMHWHGILLPPEMDGVPYVTTKTILPGESLKFSFKIRQNGTYWYHSHTNVQEQKGLYGAIVIQPKKAVYRVDQDLVVVISDWSDENPTQILKNLKKDGEYYARKKNTVRSWWGALQNHSFGNLLYNEWSRMGGMDLSDVGYDAFLMNGKKDSVLSQLKKNQTARIRIINAGASSYFYVRTGNLPLKVISADGVDIEPTEADELLMGMAETYDILFTAPENKSYELRATAQDVTGFASTWIGAGSQVPSSDKVKADLYAKMDHAAHAEHSAHHHHGHSQRIGTLGVEDIKSETPTAFPSSAPKYDLKLVLDGDMDRYVWHINGKAIHQERFIDVREGEVVRYTFVNKTMMHHPMHLHGHFFRVVNKFGEYSPLKHTVDVPPMGERTLEFYTNEPGQWMLHCHNLYHLKSGMARVVNYISFQPKPEVLAMQKDDPHLHDHMYYYGSALLSTTHAEGIFRASQTWNSYELRLESEEEYAGGIEGDILYRRHFKNTLSVAIGGTSFDYDEKSERGLLGISYRLPMLIDASFYVDTEGELRFDFAKEFQWTEHLSTDLEFRLREGEPTDGTATLMYSNAWCASYGLVFKRDLFGIGFRAQL